MWIEREPTLDGEECRSYQKFGLVPGYTGQRDRGKRYQPAHQRMKKNQVAKRRAHKKRVKKQRKKR
jgi:hypothetical protein